MPRRPTTQTAKTARKPGQPRKSDYPRKLGPYRCTPPTWDLLDQAAAVSDLTKRQIVEDAVAAHAQAIINAHTTVGGTNARRDQEDLEAREVAST